MNNDVESPKVRCVCQNNEWEYVSKSVGNWHTWSCKKCETLILTDDRGELQWFV